MSATEWVFDEWDDDPVAQDDIVTDLLHDKPADDDERLHPKHLLGVLWSLKGIVLALVLLVASHLWGVIVDSHPMYREGPAPAEATVVLVGAWCALAAFVAVAARTWERDDWLPWVVFLLPVLLVVSAMTWVPGDTSGLIWYVTFALWPTSAIVFFLVVQTKGFGLERAAQSALAFLLAIPFIALGLGGILWYGKGTLFVQLPMTIPWVVTRGDVGWEYVVEIGGKLQALLWGAVAAGFFVLSRASKL